MRMASSLGRALAVAAVLVLGACGDGEDRPGQVTSEGSGSGTGSASGTGTGSASGAGSPSGAHEHGQGAVASFSKSEADSQVAVTLTDYAIAMPATVKGKKVFFEATNGGAAEHELLVVDDHGDELGGIEPFAKAAGQKTVALELEPGSYKAVCLVKEGAKTHQELGMEASFTVE